MCMRTTLDIDDHLLRQAKKLAAEEGKTLTSIIEEALRDRFVPKTRTRKKFKMRPLTKAGRIIPGTNLADRDLLYERMEGRS